MNLKPNNVIHIGTNLDEVFKFWFKLLAPFHKLTNREIDVIACFVKHRFLLEDAIKDQATLDRMILSVETKKIVREECGLSVAHFQMKMKKLRESGIIERDRINPKYIPRIIKGEKQFQLLFLFDINE